MRVAGGQVGGREREASGIMLMECLFYLSIWMVVVGLGFTLFYRVYSQSKQLARVSDQVVQTLRAGEQWRKDVRGSRAAPRWEPREQGTGEFILEREGVELAYRVEGTNLLKKVAVDGRWQEVLSGLKTCRFWRDEAGGVVSWRWEVELSSRAAHPPVRPRFSFQAVPGGSEEVRP